MKPIGVILKTIEIGKRGPARRIFAAKAIRVGMKVPKQSHGPNGETSGGSPVQTMPEIEEAILMIHQAVKGIGGAMSRGMVVGWGVVAPCRQILRTIA